MAFLPSPLARANCWIQVDMNFNTLSSPSQDYPIATVDDEKLDPKTMTNDDQDACSSSDDDDLPLRTRLPKIREAVNKGEGTIEVRERRPRRENAREPKDYASRDHTPQRQPPKPALKSAAKGHKKPGPRPWAAKPIMKNDMVAKMEVIREIEGFWGKNFIKSYIPQCHRPLVKRGKKGKRSFHREHETNPKNWLPSVLKAILMIAKLTKNKTWLKKAMNEVVRYRIKNTGNRKPQLVTTDFDVIEDMLVKEWTVDYSFDIRYKHLMVNRKDQLETDEDIDHILGVGSDHADGSEDDEDNADEDIEAQAEVDEDGSDDEDTGQSGLTGQYMQASGYTQPLQYLMPAPPQQQKQQKLPKQKQKQLKQELPNPSQGMYGYGGQAHGYGPPMDPWGRPLPGYGGPQDYGRYGGYGRYEHYGGYALGPPEYPGGDPRRRQGSQQPPTRGMHQFPPYPMGPPAGHRGYESSDRNPNERERFSPFGTNRRGREGYEQTPMVGMSPLDADAREYQNAFQRDRQDSIKRETSELEERINSPDDMDGSVNDADEEAIDAELAAVELQLKVAQLRAKKAAMRKQQQDAN
ncbi:hypothetical protein P153DRAFT_143805 [Dothidotthia symphoricarpi CBS 119687]|uniref:Uncharacterized protein n=1 Tax=Dothidotthia symphoricarpi CBS 119687 TaxID=1392245 RepID=A0A6A5ZX10_9PLEO|nr:uncharacterized protein P153DRAFT_143805 [Dothidotthia symphoricarpi CBS 119687]KAF2124069.1 hypothetical protein P153DRAFT_143805 [Dothidotthia symphoricarpi CBS 119687]